MPISVLVTQAGDPEASSDVVRRLGAWGLRLTWQRQMRQWAVVRPWPESDRRWRWVQEQRYPRESAHDILGYIPNECDTDQVPGYVERLVREWPLEAAAGLLAQMQNTVSDVTPDVAAAVEEAVAETVETVTAPLKRKPGRPRKDATPPASGEA